MGDIIDFEKDIAGNKINGWVSDVADSVIENFFSNGLCDYDGAVNGLRNMHIETDDLFLRKTLMSFVIREIENKGRWEVANKLRELMPNDINPISEEINRKLRERRMQDSNVEKKKQTKNPIEKYTDVFETYNGLSESDTKCEKETVKNIIKSGFDFSKMESEEKFNLLKLISKYAFWNGDVNMKELTINNNKHTVRIKFRTDMPFDADSKNAFAYLLSGFDTVSFNNSGNIISVWFGFFEY